MKGLSESAGRHAPELERMKLLKPQTWQEQLYQKLILGSLVE